MLRDKTTQELAELLDIDIKTIQRWKREGLPHNKKPKPHKFNAGEVAEWMKINNKTAKVGRPSTPMSGEREALEIRKLAALVRKYEREEKVDEGLLIDAAEEQRRDIAKITLVRNRLSGLGASIAPQLEGLDGAERQTLIDESIATILKEFSAG